jgi:uncharacterized protein YrrD
MGSIYKRGKTYWIKYYRNGKPYRESAKSTKESVAKRLLKKREGEIGLGKLPGIYFDRVTFDELADDFLTDYKINNKKSLSAAKNNVRHLRKYFEWMQVTDITTPMIHAYIEYRSMDREKVEELSKEGLNTKEIAKIMKASLANVNRALKIKDEISRVKCGATKATINRDLAC